MTQQANPRAEGRLANEYGLGRDACPYDDRNDWRQNAWLVGYDEQQALREELEDED